MGLDLNQPNNGLGWNHRWFGVERGKSGAEGESGGRRQLSGRGAFGKMDQWKKMADKDKPGLNRVCLI
jgi:hypothetical protein